MKNVFIGTALILSLSYNMAFGAESKKNIVDIVERICIDQGIDLGVVDLTPVILGEVFEIKVKNCREFSLAISALGVVEVEKLIFEDVDENIHENEIKTQKMLSKEALAETAKRYAEQLEVITKEVDDIKANPDEDNSSKQTVARHSYMVTILKTLYQDVVERYSEISQRVVDSEYNN